MVCVEINGPKKKKPLQDWDEYDDDEYIDLDYDDYEYDERYNNGDYDESLDYEDTYDRYL